MADIKELKLLNPSPNLNVGTLSKQVKKKKTVSVQIYKDLTVAVSAVASCCVRLRRQ